MIDHEPLARELFLRGYNCAQAVACAFGDVTGLEIDAAARMSSSFGAGMGRMREVCGTVSGALLVLGIARGYADPADDRAKAGHYHLVQEYARRFRELNGTIICRELLRDVETMPGAVPEPRTPEFYAKRPCLRIVGEAARVADEMLAETLPNETRTGGIRE